MSFFPFIKFSTLYFHYTTFFQFAVKSINFRYSARQPQRNPSVKKKRNKEIRIIILTRFILKEMQTIIKRHLVNKKFTAKT